MSNNSPFSYSKGELPIEGETYYIDENQNNKEAIVVVLKVYGRVFCRVKNIDRPDSDGWDTMCSRLTKIDK